MHADETPVRRTNRSHVELHAHLPWHPAQAFEAVLMADRVRWALVKEERTLMAELAVAPDEAKDSRLAAVYDEVYMS